MISAASLIGQEGNTNIKWGRRKRRRRTITFFVINAISSSFPSSLVEWWEIEADFSLILDQNWKRTNLKPFFFLSSLRERILNLFFFLSSLRAGANRALSSSSRKDQWFKTHLRYWWTVPKRFGEKKGNAISYTSYEIFFFLFCSFRPCRVLLCTAIQ